MQTQGWDFLAEHRIWPKRKIRGVILRNQPKKTIAEAQDKQLQITKDVPTAWGGLKSLTKDTNFNSILAKSYAIWFANWGMQEKEWPSFVAKFMILT